MPQPEDLLRRLPESMQAGIRRSVPLRDLTTLRVGGPAAWVCPLRTTEEAVRFQALCLENGIESYILGAGSNVLAADEGFGGLILKVATESFEQQGDIVTAGAGLPFDRMIELSLAAGLTGLEFASGIPGTLGGALVGNAGCYGHEIGDFLIDALVLSPDGTLHTLDAGQIGFRYRATDLREAGGILLEARFRLTRGDLHRAEASRREKIDDRMAKHPVSEPSAGSWFRNLEADTPGGRRQPAGRLLEEAGAKQMIEGGARVFPKHANIIVNAGGATSGDVSRLARRMQVAVRAKFGIELQEEVRRLGGPPRSDAT